MKIHIVDPGSFKLDGGATFGVVPKSLWSKIYPSDENNMCLFALRSLLIETDNRIILIDTGIGNKQEDKFFRHYYREGHHSIELSIEEAGFKADQITDVVLTHLHFDHVGGAVRINEKGEYLPAFPNARHYISYSQWEWANNPNQREKASYLKENIMPLKDAGVITLIHDNFKLTDNITLRIFNGHTEGLIVPFVQFEDKTLVYTTDLIPTAAHISPSWVCGYDTRPLLSFDERERFLKEAVDNNYHLIFQHDAYIEGCTLKQTEKGVKIDAILKVQEDFN